jgi:hypothetical protein
MCSVRVLFIAVIMKRKLEEFLSKIKRLVTALFAVCIFSALI